MIFTLIVCVFFFLYFWRINHQLKQELKNDLQIMDGLKDEIASLNEKISEKQDELSVLSENERADELTLWEHRFEQLKEVAK